MDELEHTEREPSTDEMIEQFQQENAQQQSEPQTEQTQPETWAAPEWAQFDWNGKRVTPDSAEKAKIWLSQGYNYSQRMAELNNQRREMESFRKDWEPKVKRYEEVDKYIQQNPEWWQHVEQSWQSRGSQQPQVSPDLAPVLQPIQEKLGQFETFMTQLQQEREAAQQKEQDSALDREIESIRAKYPNIDMGAVDETGMTLELRVLKHANETGIPTFRAAFHDYLSDRLIDMARAEGKENVARQAQADRSKGILGKTPAPTKGLTPARNLKSTSWDQLGQEALAELGLI